MLVDLQLQGGALFCVNYRKDLGVFFILFIDTKNHNRTTENADTCMGVVRWPSNSRSRALFLRDHSYISPAALIS